MGTESAPIEAAFSIASAIDDYIRHLRRRGRSEHTVSSYLWALQDLAGFLGPERALGELQERDLENWQDHVLERGLAERSRGLIATAARSWLRWAMERDLLDWRVARAVTTVRRKKGRPHPIDPEDLARIKAHLAGVGGPGSTLRQLRDRALFYLLLTSGFRISEALQLRRVDWRKAIVTQKGGTPKALVVPRSVIEMVAEYEARRQDDLPWLWVTVDPAGCKPGDYQPRQLGHEGAGRIWRTLAHESGVRRWTNHELRHTCGTELARAGLPIQVIADHLGHEGLATVLNYVAIVEEQREQKVEALEGMVTPPSRPWVKLRGRPDRRRRAPGGRT